MSFCHFFSHIKTLSILPVSPLPLFLFIHWIWFCSRFLPVKGTFFFFFLATVTKGLLRVEFCPGIYFFGFLVKCLEITMLPADTLKVKLKLENTFFFFCFVQLLIWVWACSGSSLGTKAQPLSLSTSTSSSGGVPKLSQTNQETSSLQRVLGLPGVFCRPNVPENTSSRRRPREYPDQTPKPPQLAAQSLFLLFSIWLSI